MNLDENQKLQVAQWLADGLQLAEVQRRLEEEFGARLTYMEVKFLVSDLNLKPRDPEPEKPSPPVAAEAGPGLEDDAGPGHSDDVEDEVLPEEAEPLPPGGGVRVAVDQLARPGAMISGKVTFANGKTCEWMLDQMGRLGVVPGVDGFKPGPADLQEFQFALQGELQRLGF